VILGLIFFVALAMRLALLPSPVLGTKTFDARSVAYDGYYEIANSISAGHGFSRSVAPPYIPDSVRMPLYPLFIMGILKIFGSYKALFIIQALLGSLSAVLAYFIAKEFITEKWSAGVGFLTALEPYTAYLTGIVLTETFFTFVFLCFVYFFLRYLKGKSMRMLALTSALLGIATLIKPTTQYLPILMLALVWWNSGFNFRKFLLKEVPVVLGIFLIILSPWIYRNYETFGNMSLNVEPVSALYAFLVPSTIALEQNIPFDEAAQRFLGGLSVQKIEDVNLANTSEFRRSALAELRNHPKGLAELFGITMYGFFTHDGYASLLNTFFDANISYAHPPVFELITHPGEAVSFFGNLMRGPGALVVVGRLFWIAVTLLALAGAIAYWRKKGLTPQFLFITGTIAYFALTTIIIGLGVNARLRVPVEPLIFILAAFALQRMFRQKFPEKYAGDIQSNSRTPIRR